VNKAVPAVSNDTPAAAAIAAAESAHSAKVALFLGKTKEDPAIAKLMELRARNAAAAAAGDGDDTAAAGSDSDDSDESSGAVAAAAAAARAARTMPQVSALETVATLVAQHGLAGAPLATAADLLAARERLDAAGTKHGLNAFGSRGGGAGTDGAGSRKLRMGARSKPGEEDDFNVLRAAMWSADGTTRLATRRELPPSAYSAYTPRAMPVTRSTEVAESRSGLPVCSMESEIMETVGDHDVVVLCGETGSGKTTQVPQFLYEAGYGVAVRDVTRTSPSPTRPAAAFAGVPGIIAITQPRRVAATAMAERVCRELTGSAPSKTSLVGYQVRYDTATVGAATRLKFMTDGILVREIQDDLLLRRYSVIVLDEAHERNINTDVLIGMLSRALPLRNKLAGEEAAAYAAHMAAGGAHPPPVLSGPDGLPLPPLKLIIMSATLRVSDFTANPALFPVPPPVVRVEARQFPVTVHFSKTTELVDYVGEAYKKVVKIHTRLPEGGILVFLTGADEIEDLSRRLRARFAPRARAAPSAPADAAAPAPAGDAAARAPAPAPAAATDATADTTDADKGKEEEKEEAGVHVLPLYAVLSKTAQMRVFAAPPEGKRMIVVATNVAETSLTIPGIRYVPTPTTIPPHARPPTSCRVGGAQAVRCSSRTLCLRGASLRHAGRRHHSHGFHG